jgi:branched-chain amino acid aminotransferase
MLEQTFSPREIMLTIEQLIRINNIKSGPVKLYFAKRHGRLDFMAYLMKPYVPQPEEYLTGVKTVSLKEMRSNPNIKVWNESLRGKTIELINRSHAFEVILVDSDGYILEGSRSNIFFIRDDTVFTTPGEYVLKGITRKKVLEVCERLGIQLEFRKIRYGEIMHYNASFLTGTSRKVVPVKSIDNFNFSVSDNCLLKISVGFESLVAEYIAMKKQAENS